MLVKNAKYTLAESRELHTAVKLICFQGDTSAITTPGEFVQVEIPGKFLRRPFSVCDWSDGWFSLIVQQVGSGTEILHQLPVGTELDILTGLGKGFTAAPDTSAPLLIGCGTGLSPLVGLAKRLIKPKILLGFRDVRDAFGLELFEGLDVTVSSDVLSELSRIPHDYFYACGSEQMMQLVCETEPNDGQVAFDVRMGCGFGACMGCSKKTTDGWKRVCKDGPVFRKGELLWTD